MIVELIPSLRFKEFTQEFELSKLEDIVQKKISYGIVQAGPHVEGGMPYIKSKNLNNELRVIDLDRTSTEIAKKYKRSEVGPGDIVFSLRGNIGVSRIVPDSITVANLTQGTARLSLKAGFSAKYIQEELRTSRIKNRIEAISKGSTFQEISLTDLRTVKVAIPEKAEQQKIANFLASVDTKISQLTEKHRLLKDYKKGVMQQIFSQKVRFKDDNGNAFPDWKEKVIGDVMTESRIKGNSGDIAKKLTVKIWGKGVIPKKDDSKGSENTQYYKRKAGQFIYGKLDFLNCAFAIIPDELDGYESTLDLPSLDVSSLVNKFFVLEVVKQKRFYKRFGEIADGSRKAKRINVGVFQKMPITLPSKAEQNKIMAFLDSLDKKTNAVNEQIEQTKLFKKGLLQQMFV
ncbi:restriction endonuclease subunit S [Pseudoalteromonas sp. Angola-30]|uniref:restriction endonuclease subunit S n=1 Tax=Pseudoalteromonas sp. Angola-30 TaxID=3025341 RepID=UPI0023598066|nr:restriction endonuclease subunit S [Pseudoalteromonas sp. Angola-30]MDC9527755.1 restriction endonuclease subunit S [Pseudoalteromonas sp. Angola-30]